jgi:uncharacterized membrane protein (DUF485 family)
MKLELRQPFNDREVPRCARNDSLHHFAANDKKQRMASDSRIPEDPTPRVGAPTDMARLSHATPKPPHELTADEETRGVNWESIASSARFRELLRAKRRFIVPAMIVFVLYYFALPVLVGYAPTLMETRVFGAVNLAYLFALSQFFMAWIIAALYVRAANRFDRMAREVIEHEGK